LTERFKVNEAAGFELLRSLSEQSNAKLIDVAEKPINADYPNG
jgi:hypothetical protein